MAEYYYIGTLLPDLKMGEKPELSFHEFEQLLKENLQADDYKRVEQVQRFYSIENMRALWRQDTLEAYGMDAHALEEFLLNSETLPNYLSHFLEQHSSDEQRLRFFPELLTGYFKGEAKASKAKGFVSHYLEFERKLHLVQTAFRAKKMKRDLSAELQFEDLSDSFIQQLLAQKESAKFIAPPGFERLQELLEKQYEAPIELYKALCEYRFEMLEEFAGFDVFSINRILAYMVQLILVERWLKLDREKGNKMVDQYIKEPA